MLILYLSASHSHNFQSISALASSPKFLQQNQEPTHEVKNAELPPHLYPDGPFLVPVSTSIWQPIKICRLCYEFYDKYDLFNHNTNITRSTIIRPTESSQNFRQKKYVGEIGNVSENGSNPVHSTESTDKNGMDQSKWNNFLQSRDSVNELRFLDITYIWIGKVS